MLEKGNLSVRSGSYDKVCMDAMCPLPLPTMSWSSNTAGALMTAEPLYSSGGPYELHSASVLRIRERGAPAAFGVKPRSWPGRTWT